ncbi:Maltase-glucoamylase, intestinal, partial [Armadillidium vulgare]
IYILIYILYIIYRFRTRGPLTFEDQFIQITTSLASSYFYGIGEFCHSSLLRSFDQRTTNALFASDRGPSPGSDVNLYGSYPYYLNIEDDDGNTHSFVGRPYLPPYWALGFQLSRWGYNSLDEYQVIHDRMIASQIPWDVQHFDIDYMDGRRDFTYDQVNFNNISTVADQLHSENKKLILIKDPGIAIDFDTYPTVQRGKDKDVFIKYSDPSYVPDDQPALTDDFVVGNVWPINNTLFPDFFNPVTAQWWSEELQLFHETVEFDAIWIDMDEPSNFYTNLGQFFEEIGRFSLQCPNNTLDFPPYGTLATFSDNNPNPGLSDKTICMSSIQTDGTNQYLHYDIHNLYGYSEAVATYNALSQDVFPNERPFILTRSSFPGSAPYTSHWLGDNTATFADLRASLIGIVEFSFFGIFDDRWLIFVAFNGDCRGRTLCTRNHNMIGTTDQDPARPDWPTLNQVSKDIVTLRYKYLPFMYSAIHRAHMFGNPAIRSLFVVFPSDLDARGIQDQFMWSDKLLVAPVVYEQATSRDVYFPDSLWYDLQSGTLEAQGPITSTVDAPIGKIPLYVRGGSILPFQFPSKNESYCFMYSIG